jgi:hypothetical protein
VPTGIRRPVAAPVPRPATRCGGTPVRDDPRSWCSLCQCALASPAGACRSASRLAVLRPLQADRVETSSLGRRERPHGKGTQRNDPRPERFGGRCASTTGRRVSRVVLSHVWRGEPVSTFDRVGGSPGVGRHRFRSGSVSQDGLGSHDISGAAGLGGGSHPPRQCPTPGQQSGRSLTRLRLVQW